MEKEINKNKKKVKIKANTSIEKTLLLKKEFLYNEKVTDTLVLKNIVRKKTNNRT